MAAQDVLAFLQERVREFDPSIDTEEGGDFYQKVLRPLAGRIGPDPFTTDVRAFLLDVLSRNFPQLASGGLDALTDALVVPIEAFLGPVTAEITRISRANSLKYPDQLSVEEAEALGANLLEERATGEYARGPVRVLYRNPQSRRFTRAHVFYTEDNLSFTPIEDQSISAEEMLLQVEGSLYYMTVTVIATAPGDQYNIEPNSIRSVQGSQGHERVYNPYRFTRGQAEQTAEEFVASLPDRAGAKGMTQPAGIVRELSDAFPITRIAVVGHGDPEMERDTVEGGSLGEQVDSGFAATTTLDGEGLLTTKLVTLTDATQDLVELGSNLVLSVMHPDIEGRSVDVDVEAVLSSTALLLKDSVLLPGLTGMYWSLRRREFRIAASPLLGLSERFSTLPNKVHLGGAVDVYLRGTEPDASSSVIDVLDDELPALSGESLSGSSSTVTLADLVLGTTYTKQSAVWLLIQRIWSDRWALEILDGPAAGTYEILDVVEAEGSPLTLVLYSELPATATDARWRILDDMNVDLRAPKRVRYRGVDMETVQGLTSVSTTQLTSFLDVGVEEGDTLEILSGKDKGVYQVVAIAGPGNVRLTLNAPLTTTASSIQYVVYKENEATPIELPLLKLTEVTVLDSSGQSLGVTVPYGPCLGGLSQGISNPVHGVKLSVPDALLGIVSQRLPSGASISGRSLLLFFEELGSYTVVFSGTNPLSVASIVSQINAAVGRSVATLVGTDRFGIHPVGGKEAHIVGPTGFLLNPLTTLFGGRYPLTTKSIRSPSFTKNTFSSLNPALSLDYDVVQFQDGNQVGVYGIEGTTTEPASVPLTGLYNTNTIVADITGGFLPEADVRLDLGARSVGTVRCFFVDPVTVEFDESTSIVHKLGSGTELKYQPDPHYESVILPAAPSGSKPHDGNCVGGDKVLSSNLDMRAKQIRKGDKVRIDYVPLFSSVLADTVVGLANKTLILSYGSESAQTLTFVRDSSAVPATDVSRKGVLAQLQRFLGTAVTLGTDNKLKIDPEFLLSFGRAGTANSYLGLSTSQDTSNLARNSGVYTVDVPGNLGCTLKEVLPYAENYMQFSILRVGSQRIGSTQMSKQVGEGGLYYVDIEVVSRGTGDIYNLSNAELFEISGHFHDGYELYNHDPRFTFSTEEDLWMKVPRRVIPVGSNDDPEQAVYLLNHNLQLAGESSSVVREVQDFLLSDAGRDVCSSPLALALTPHYVCFSLGYTGGPVTSVVEEALNRTIHALFPNEELAVDVLVEKLRGMSAAAVTLPLRLFAVVADRDRRLRLLASQDRIAVSKQAAFYPYRISLSRTRG